MSKIQNAENPLRILLALFDENVGLVGKVCRNADCSMLEMGEKKVLRGGKWKISRSLAICWWCHNFTVEASGVGSEEYIIKVSIYIEKEKSPMRKTMAVAVLKISAFAGPLTLSVNKLLRESVP